MREDLIEAPDAIIWRLRITSQEQGGLFDLELGLSRAPSGRVADPVSGDVYEAIAVLTARAHRRLGGARVGVFLGSHPLLP